MANTDSDFQIKVTGDSSQAQSDLDALAGKTEVYGKTAQDTGEKAKEGAGTIGEAFGELRAQAAELFAGEKLVEYGEEIIDLSDQYDQLASRVQIAVGTQQDAQTALAGIADVANRTEQSLQTVGSLYLEVAEGTRNLGLSQQQTLGITETLTDAIRLSGGQASEAAGEVSRLARGLADGSVDSKAFTGAIERIPVLADAIATQLGVSREELKKLASDGVLSSQQLATAILGAQEQIRNQAEQLPETVEGAVTKFRNELTLYASSLNDSIGLSKTAITVLGSLASNLDTLGNVAAAGVEIAFVKLAASIASKVKASREAVEASQAEVEAQRAEIESAQEAALAEQEALEGKLAGIKVRYDAASASHAEAVAQLESAEGFRAAALAESQAATAGAELAIALGDQDLAVQGLSAAAGKLELAEAGVATAQRAASLATNALAVEQEALVATQNAAAAAAARAAIAQEALASKTDFFKLSAFGATGAANLLILGLVGFQVALPILEKVGTTLGEYTAKIAGADNANKALTANRIVQLNEEIDKLDPVLRGLDQYKDAQLLSAEEVQKLGSAAQIAYKQQLDGLQQYLNTNNSVLLREKDLAQQRGLSTKEYDEELAKNNASLKSLHVAQSEFVDALNLAADALQNHVSPQAQQLANRFDLAVKSGKSLSEAITEIGKGIDPAAIKSVDNYVSALGLLEAQGKITQRELEDDIGKTLKSLSADELNEFQINAEAAFGGVSGKAALLGQTLQSVRDQQLSRLGVDAQQAATGISKAVNDSITSIRSLGSNTQTTGSQMEAALEGAINSAKTREEAQAVVDAVGGIKIAGFDAAGAVRGLQGAIDALPSETARLSPLEEALKRLGVESQDALNRAAQSAKDDFTLIASSGTQGAGVVADAFSKMAAAELKAAAAAGDTQSAITAGALRSQAATDQQQAALDKLASTYPDLGKSAFDTGDAVVTAARKSSDAIGGVTAANEQAGASGIEAGNEISDGYTKAEDSALAAQAAIDGVSTSFEKATASAAGAGGDLDDEIENLRQTFVDMGTAATTAFDAVAKDATVEGESVSDYISNFNQGISRLNQLAAEDKATATSLISQLSAKNVSEGAIKIAESTLTNAQYLDSKTKAALQAALTTAQQAVASKQTPSSSTVSTPAAATPVASTPAITSSQVITVNFVVAEDTFSLFGTSDDATGLIRALQNARAVSLRSAG